MGPCSTWFKRPFFLSVLWSIGVLILSGCGVNLGPEGQAPETKLYMLEYPAPEPSAEQLGEYVLRVEQFDALPFYQTDRIIYKENAFQRDSYRYHKWQASPGEMITYLLLRDFRGSGLFKAVLSPDSLLAPTHGLEGEIEDFLEEDSPKGWVAVLSLNVTLTSETVPGAGRTVIFQSTYSEREPLRGKTPRALSEAMSRAMSRISTLIIGDVQSAVAGMEGMNTGETRKEP